MGIFLMMFRSPARLVVLKFPRPVHDKHTLRSGFMSILPEVKVFVSEYV